MKKLLAILLAVMMFASMATIASAASTTTLTTTVPAATYTLNIPANQEIAFGATKTGIGSVTVTDATGFAVGKNLAVTLTYDAFTSSSVATKIPFEVSIANDSSFADSYKVASGDSVTFYGKADGSTDEYTQSTVSTTVPDLKHTFILITSEDWGKALAGEYTATITFTAEVVVE